MLFIWKYFLFITNRRSYNFHYMPPKLDVLKDKMDWRKLIWHWLCNTNRFFCQGEFSLSMGRLLEELGTFKLAQWQGFGGLGGSYSGFQHVMVWMTSSMHFHLCSQPSLCHVQCGSVPSHNMSRAILWKTVHTKINLAINIKLFILLRSLWSII